MSTAKTHGLVRVACLWMSALLIATGTGCAWRGAANVPMTGQATAPMTTPTNAPTTAPEPVRQSAGAPALPAIGAAGAASIKTPPSAALSVPPSSPPVPRNSASSPSDTPALAPSLPKVDHKRHAGNYRCDHGRTIRIADVPDQLDVILLTWQGTQHRLERVRSNSGAERFEELATGLVWILIPGKAMLLSTNQGRALANECHL